MCHEDSHRQPNWKNAPMISGFLCCSAALLLPPQGRTALSQQQMPGCRCASLTLLGLGRRHVCCLPAHLHRVGFVGWRRGAVVLATV